MKALMQWLIPLATTVALALASWGLSSAVSTRERLSVVETKTGNIEHQLDRIEQKLDRVIERNPK